MNMQMKTLSTLWLGGLCLLLSHAALAQGVQLTTVVNFNNTNGANPNAALTQGTDGFFYGTTRFGGTNRNGTVFKLATNGVFNQFISFNIANYSPSASYTNDNGAYPNAGLTVGPDGYLYGLTEQGGTYGYGTVFKVTTNGTLATLVHLNNTNGAYPDAALTLGTDGSFYGTTSQGGGNNIGTLFNMMTNGDLTTLVHFNNTNGAYPYAALASGTDGSFYGTASSGGNFTNGTIFKIATNGTLTTLVHFNGTNGAYPSAALTFGVDGGLYGTTYQGGSNNAGTVFKVSTNGTLTSLFSFAANINNGSGTLTNLTGANPYAALTPGGDGSFYGSTYLGGTNGSGTLFEVTTNGTFHAFLSFGPKVSSTNATGANPYAALTVGSDGSFYGSTVSGGISGRGTIFKLLVPSSLQIQEVAGQVIVIWSSPAFSLQSAPEATGIYSNISGATSPYTNLVSDGRRFFRLIAN